ncbi:glycosyltransferase [Cellvibrio sp. KY-GH-1]|uniref:WecB/TagA/CpsF family glycosyltransferase n=1 Tax=Cellvibrio sp. KY-GH-1 TaxID=2303332 RepID=UPI001248CEF9|nr:WecB/TagA/CpsF family glycosyltransferase [Cellvibrio sp. KY-GH-1]QEY16194.1 glycosyltransferase [Cellvibrio sp. KY-GH-1]
MSNESFELIPLGGFFIHSTSSKDLSRQLRDNMEHQQTTLLFANTNFIVQCQALKNELANSNTIIVNDGVGIDIATWLIHRKKFRENLNGTDFTPLFLQHLGKDAKVFLVGAKPGIAMKAAQHLQTDLQIEVVGYRNGYDEASDAEVLIDAINSSGANVVLIAMGNPNQEHWILKHRQRLNTKVLIGVGALLDFLAGEKPRAPKTIQKLRLEWFYRLCLEPGRLLRRYTLDIAVFLQLCLRQGKSLH